MIIRFIVFLVLLFEYLAAQPVAFPGAEGFGRYTTGGRGGSVIEVTNLNDAGTGSLREAILSRSARTVVFRVSGVIELESPLLIHQGNLTIAGQTAPGAGICIKNYPVLIEADNIIIRYMRFRMGDLAKIEADALSALNQKDIIIDHCSMSWGNDEVATFTDNANCTVQWCIISESLHHSYHHKGAHGYGGIWGGKGASFHHNLIAHHASRNPRFNGSRTHGHPELEIVDFRNNVIYNWGFNSAYGGEGGNHNIIANYFKSGPGSKKKNRIVEPWNKKSIWYVANNFVVGYPKITTDNWNGGVQGKYRNNGRTDSPIPCAPMLTHSAEQAFELVLTDAGAVLPKRDAVDVRIVTDARNGTATFGGLYGTGTGIIDSQTEVGGWPELHTAPSPPDDDHDGMTNDWETAHGLDPKNPADRNDDPDGDGYTNLEEYLNALTIRRDYIIAPAGLRTLVSSRLQIALSWNEDSFYEDGFLIERSVNDTNHFVEIATVPTNTTSYTDSDVVPATTYYYRIRAFCGAEYSIYTNIATVKTAAQ